jgi:hypothetical protein
MCGSLRKKDSGKTSREITQKACRWQPGQRRPFAVATGITGKQKPVLPRRYGSGSVDAIVFSGGDDARIHLVDDWGGVPGCIAHCRDGSAHSFPQVTSAGRNLITVFSTVNNLLQLFFVVPGVSGPATQARCARL